MNKKKQIEFLEKNLEAIITSQLMTELNIRGLEAISLQGVTDKANFQKELSQNYEMRKQLVIKRRKLEELIKDIQDDRFVL